MSRNPRNAKALNRGGPSKLRINKPRPYRFAKHRELDGCRKILFGPAEFGEGLLKARERQANHVEIATFNARNVARSVALNGVSTGFVVGLAGSEVARDYLVGERGERYQSCFDEGNALGVRKADEAHAGEYGVRAARKFGEHAAGVVGSTRLAENVAIEDDFGVCGDDDGRTHGARDGEFRLGF